MQAMAETLLDLARRALSYDPETGVFVWKVSRGHIAAGTVAGTVVPFGKRSYRLIGLADKKYMAHRLAWLMMTGEFPPEHIDHRNGDGLNNRWANIRAASAGENARNSQKRSDNKSGHKGVSLDSWTGRWVARIRVPKGSYRNLGRFDTPDDAATAYAHAARKLYGEFARLG